MTNQSNMDLTPEQVANLKEWQNADYVHPLTCGSCSCRSPLAVIDDGSGLRCVSCKNVQSWVPDICLEGPSRWRELRPFPHLVEAPLADEQV